MCFDLIKTLHTKMFLVSISVHKLHKHFIKYHFCNVQGNRKTNCINATHLQNRVRTSRTHSVKEALLIFVDILSHKHTASPFHQTTNSKAFNAFVWPLNFEPVKFQDYTPLHSELPVWSVKALFGDHDDSLATLDGTFDLILAIQCLVCLSFFSCRF